LDSSRNFGRHLKLEQASLALNLTSPEALHFDPEKASSRRLTSPRSDLSLTFKRSKLQHLSILEQYNTHIEDIGIHG